MKKISVIIVAGIFLLFMNFYASAQSAIGLKDSAITPYHLDVTFYKTTNLVFPYAIKSVDKGSRDILAQKTKGIENILQVKAGKRDFSETNMTVITADGKLYSYIMNYVDSPAVLNIQYDAAGYINPDAFFSQGVSNEASVQINAERVAGKAKTLRRIRDKEYGMELSLNNVFIRDDIMYYQLKIKNLSAINFGIDQFRFYIRDKKRSKRTASQELEIKPLYVHNKHAEIGNLSEEIFVFAFPKFTIPEKKYLAVQLMELNGGRNMKLSINNRTIMKAQPIN